MSSVAAAVAALRAGKPVVLAFDTVYGIAALAETDAPTRRLYELKGRVPAQPSALVSASVAQLVAAVPELRGKTESLLHDLLPGPYTLIVANPARRFRWLTGDKPDTVGVRVPQLPATTHEVIATVGPVVATSANHPGERDPSTLDDVPSAIRAGAGAAIDGGRLPGTPSTVVDLTGAEPVLVRRGAASPDELLRRLGAAVRSG
ncbi:MAG: L-threonylcarbamoyladenylate synthase [Gaiellaceae bacterium]